MAKIYYCYLINFVVIDLFELEGNFVLVEHLVQLPCNEQGYLHLNQVAQSLIHPDLECLQGWSIQNLSGQSLETFFGVFIVVALDMYQ